MPTKKTDNSKSAAGKSAAAKKAPGKAAAKPAARKTAAKPTAAKSKAAAVVEAPKRVVKVKPERPAPERVPGRKERRGVVVSSAMDKTIVVRIDVVKKHDVYGKVVRRSSKLHVHDEHNTAGVGDVVRVVETRPLSATKRWRLLDVLEKAK